MNRIAPKSRAVKQQKKTKVKPVRQLATRATKKQTVLQTNTSLSYTKLTPLLSFSRRSIVTTLETAEDAEQFIKTHSNSKKLVIVDFFADWCGPCKRLAPQFAALSEKYPNVQFAKANADEFNSTDVNPAFPPVTALPTVMFFSDNKHLDTVVGLNEAQLVQNIEKYSV